LENIRVFVHSPNNPLTHFFFLWNLWDYLAKPFPCQEVARATFWKWVRDGSCLLGKGNERQEARNYYAAPVHPFFFWGWTRQGAARQETSWCQIESATNRLSFLNQSLVLVYCRLDSRVNAKDKEMIKKWRLPERVLHVKKNMQGRMNNDDRD